MAKISTLLDKVEFQADSDENILNAGLRNKFNLPHGCKNGACGACKCKIISGEVKLDSYNHVILNDEEIAHGYTLLCKAHAVTDVVLDLPHILDGFPIKILPSRVDSIKRINNTAVLTLKLPATQTFGFYAGQYIDIMLQGKNRSYSLASNPNQTSELELHVRYHKGGIFSEFVWHELQEKSIIRFKGPLGNFRLQDTQNPIILICTGTGFAPIKAILEDMVATENMRQINFYWGNRTQNDFYLLEYIDKYKDKLNFKATLCLSQEQCTGYSFGHVTQYLMQDFTDLSQCEVYACGNMDMIENVYNLAIQERGLYKSNFFSDAFTPSV